jgi:uncharacterized protein (TIGR03000 family)
MPETTEPAIEPGTEPPAADASTRVGRDAVMLSVWVPNDARIFVNGNTTTSTGSARNYISRGLQPGASYAYEVRAEVVRDGKTVTETKQVTLVAGQRVNIEFGFEDDGVDNVAEAPRTTLTLNVPEDAKVFLSGKETHSKGTVREFSTTRLANGSQWNDYAIRVEIERDGQRLTKEQTVSLAAGETRQVSFDFEAPQVASKATSR